ncbi:hypothetical protein [Sphaerospermopsis sp. LEGE 00249]|nr:hypothetical protein [Sphaerospermopsis sp. LEGE 00249]
MSDRTTLYNPVWVKHSHGKNRQQTDSLTEEGKALAILHYRNQ